MYLGYLVRSISKSLTSLKIESITPETFLKLRAEANAVSINTFNTIVNPILKENGISPHLTSWASNWFVKKISLRIVILLLQKNNIDLNLPFIKKYIGNTVGASNKNIDGNISDSNSVENLGFFKTFKLELLLFLACIFIYIPVLTGFAIHFKFSHFVIDLLFFGALPLFILKYMKMEKSYKSFYIVPIFITLNFIFFLLTKISDDFRYATFGINYFESLQNANSVFGVLFYLIFTFILIVDYCLMKGIKVSDKLIPKYNWLMKPVLSYSILILPFILSLIYFSFTRHKVTASDIENFNTNNSAFVGEWYFTNSDTSKIYMLRISPLRTEEVTFQYEGLVTTTIDYYISEIDGQSVGSGSLDTSLAYNAKLNLPLIVSRNLILKEIKGDKLEISTLTSNGKNEKFICQKDVAPFRNHLEKENQELSNQEKQDIIEVLTLIEGNSHEDGATITFTNSYGENISTSSVPDFIKWIEDEFGGAHIAPEFCNKKYLIKYKMESIYHEPSNTDAIEMVIKEMSLVK
ncbi:MAG: hypothetical protein HYU67_00525 [Flavobacteriia bacterium]|nr:hypothetical protein [Flavobacteriia bacterium]